MKLLRWLLAFPLVIALAAPTLAQDANFSRADPNRGGRGSSHGGFGRGLLPGLILGGMAAAAAAAARAHQERPPRGARARPPRVVRAPPPRRFRPLPPAMAEADRPPPRRPRPRPHVVEIAEPPAPRHRLRQRRPVVAEAPRVLLPAPGEKRFAPDEILVAFKSEQGGAQGPDFARQMKFAYVQARPLKLIGVTVHRLRLPPGADLRRALRQTGRDARVAWVQPNYLYQLQQGAEPAPVSAPQTEAALPPSASPPAPEGYAGPALNLAEAHRIARGQGIVIAVIDSQVDSAHPELAGLVADAFDSLDAPGEPDNHGTAMAGAISGHVKLAGVAPDARLLAVRAFAPSGGTARGGSLNIAAGLDWAADKGARIVNMSFAGPADPLLEKMLAAANAKGIALIAAAGNEGPKAPPQYPAAYRNVIAVAAVDERAKVYRKANRGDYIALAAPGVDVLAAAPRGGYDLSTGTSIACAEISGIAALVLEKNPGLDGAALRKILGDTARGLAGEADLREADAAAALQKKE